MSEKQNQKAIEKKNDKTPASPAKRKELPPVKPEEMLKVEGGACALLRFPPYWRCW